MHEFLGFRHTVADAGVGRKQSLEGVRGGCGFIRVGAYFINGMARLIFINSRIFVLKAKRGFHLF